MVAVSLKKKKKKKKKKKNIIFFFFKQKTAYEMCDSDWSSDVCSSDLTTDADGKAAVLDDILAELRAIRAAVEGTAAGDDGDRKSVV